MGLENKRKGNIIVMLCAVVMICLAGSAATAALLMQKNPLMKGLANLTKEVAEAESEMGAHFWAEAVNQIGNGNIQAEYSVNIGGIPVLQNITVGVDGKSSRDMERQLFDTGVDFSVANTEIGKASFWGKPDTLYVQVPSVWDGMVVFDMENVSGQWNRSAAKSQLQLLTGEEFGVEDGIDADLFRGFTVKPFSVADFLEENSEAFKELYKNMEVLKAEKALKEGRLEAEAAEGLLKYVLRDADGEAIETTCYFVALQEKDLREFIADWSGDLRLGVYLDSEERIVRICTLPGERLVTEFGEGVFSVNLTGEEVTIDRIEMSSRIQGDGAAKEGAIRNSETGKERADQDDDADKSQSENVRDGEGKEEHENRVFQDMELEVSVIVEKREPEKDADTYSAETIRRAYSVECDGSLTNGGNVWELSFEGSVQGERIFTGSEADTEIRVSLKAENLVLKLEDEVICRGSGEAEFAPLSEEIEIPSEREYRIAEMNEAETILFLAECTKNVYKNYSGYLRAFQ